MIAIPVLFFVGTLLPKDFNFDNLMGSDRIEIHFPNSDNDVDKVITDTATVRKVANFVRQHNTSFQKEVFGPVGPIIVISFYSIGKSVGFLELGESFIQYNSSYYREVDNAEMLDIFKTLGLDFTILNS